MGFYIEVPEDQNKAQQMRDLHGAEDWNGASFEDVPEGKTLLCIVVNQTFDAIGVCYDERLFQSFNDPSDDRPRTWLLLDTEKVIELNPRVGRVLGVSA